MVCHAKDLLLLGNGCTAWLCGLNTYWIKEIQGQSCGDARCVILRVKVQCELIASDTGLRPRCDITTSKVERIGSCLHEQVCLGVSMGKILGNAGDIDCRLSGQTCWRDVGLVIDKGIVENPFGIVIIYAASIIGKSCDGS